AGAGSAGSAGAGSAGPADGVVEVRRTGGLAGVERSGAIRLGEDPRTDQVRELLGRIDVAALGPHRPQPDRFVYAFLLRGESVTLGEDQLTPDLETLAALLLAD
ncbi:MAG TPA: protealysin inhibitor emfourin, partial [Nocardioidaceae bacterium]|nr:protealysin inhibitor emfourin [Nocardioidaceae bacterium]